MAGAIRLKVKGNGGGAPPVAISLANVSNFIMGGYTPSGQGGVRLNAIRLELLQNGTPARWEITQLTGVSGHFTGYTTGVPVSIAEGSTARTPSVTAAGRTARLQTGTTPNVYTFSITAYDINELPSNTVTLTITGDPNSVSIGDSTGYSEFNSQGNLYGGVTIATYISQTATAVAGGAVRRLYFNKGIEPRSFGLNNFDWTGGEVTWCNPDNNTPAIINFFNIQNVKYIIIDGLDFGGDWFNAGTVPAPSYNRIRLAGNTAIDHITIRNCNIGLSADELVIGRNGISGNTTPAHYITIEDCRFRWTSLCVSILSGSTNWIIRDTTMRYIHEGGVSSQNVDSLLMEDVSIFSFVAIPASGLHPDAFQKNDGFRVTNSIFRRVIVFPADSTLGCQGLYWGPTTTTPGSNLTIEGCIIAIWNDNGIKVSTNSGVSVVRNNTLIKVDTGDDTDAPVGAKKQTNGPSVGFTSESAGFPDTTMTVSDNFIGDDLNSIVVGANPAPNLVTSGNVVANLGVPTAISTYFAHGNPSTYFQGLYTNAQYAALDEAALIAVVKEGCKASASMGSAGAIDTSGNWRI